MWCDSLTRCSQQALLSKTAYRTSQIAVGGKTSRAPELDRFTRTATRGWNRSAGAWRSRIYPGALRDDTGLDHHHSEAFSPLARSLTPTSVGIRYGRSERTTVAYFWHLVSIMASDSRSTVGPST